MPYAVFHILSAIMILELFRHFYVKDNKKFPRYYILIAAIGAIIPDLDIALFYVLYFFGFTFQEIHRTFLHSIFVPLIFLTLGLVVFKFRIKNKKISERHLKLSTIFFILAFGTFLHLILDSIVSGVITPLSPFYNYKVGLNLVGYLPKGIRETFLASIEAGLLLLWIFWMEFKLKICNYF